MFMQSSQWTEKTVVGKFLAAENVIELVPQGFNLLFV